MDADSITSQEGYSSNTRTGSTLPESRATGDIRPWNEDGAQIVLVLVGLIGSGKSTFAAALEENFPEFRRCNQDDLGDRKTVENLVRTSLRQGLSVCIDRTNFDETQRSHWIRIAREFPGTRLWCVIFDTPVHICRERLQRRTNHPTIHSPEQGIEVLYRFKNMFKPPSADEGFERIFRIKPEDRSSADYSRDELQTVFMRIATSSPPRRSTPQRGVREYFEPVTPHAAKWNGNWRNRHISRGGSGRHISFSRDTKNGGYTDSSFRGSVSGSRSSNPWRSGSISVQTRRQRPQEREEILFQNDGRVGMAADQALHSGSQHGPDRTVPSRQAGDGTMDNPILLMD